MFTLSQGVTPELVSVIDGVAKTTSLIVAEKFGKRHDTVLRAIENLGCSKEFIHRNFAANEYIDSIGRKLPAFEMTRDGFTFLAMGFTGREAAKWKEAYIAAFNKMEAELLNRPPQPSLPAPEPSTLKLPCRFEGWSRDGVTISELRYLADDAVVLPAKDLNIIIARSGDEIVKRIADIEIGYIPAIIGAAMQRLTALTAPLIPQPT